MRWMDHGSKKKNEKEKKFIYIVKYKNVYCTKLSDLMCKSDEKC